MIPTIGNPEVIIKDLQASKLHVFGGQEVSISTFDSKSNYYHYPQGLNNIHQTNVLATFLKRIYTNNYSLIVKGDILVYSSIDGFPHIIDDDVPLYFLQQVILFLSNHNEKSRI